MRCTPTGTHYHGCDCWEAQRNERLAVVEAERDRAQTELAEKLTVARMLRARLVEETQHSGMCFVLTSSLLALTEWLVADAGEGGEAWATGRATQSRRPIVDRAHMASI